MSSSDQHFAMLEADVTLPKPRRDGSGRYYAYFEPPLQAESDPIAFWCLSPGFDVSGMEIIVKLLDFRTSRGDKSPWILPSSVTRGASVGDAAEFKLKVISDDDDALFIVLERKLASFTWTEGRGLPQTGLGQLHQLTATVSVDWAFQPTGKYRSYPAGTSHPSFPHVAVEFIYDEYVWRTRQLGWRCPLCERFGTFSDQFYLECHIQVHHERVEFLIDEHRVREIWLFRCAQTDLNFNDHAQ